MDNLLTLQNISKSYPFGAAQIQVLHQMNLSISQGSITAVVGKFRQIQQPFGNGSAN